MKEHLSSQQLTDWIEGLLPPAQRAALQAHLADCPACQQALATREALAGQLYRHIPAYLEQVMPPATLRWESVRARVRPRERKRSMTMWHRMRTAAAGLAVAAMLAGLLIGLNVLFQQMASPASPDEDNQILTEPGFKMSGVLSAGEGPFGYGPVTITVRAELPQVPDSVPLYLIEPALEEVSPQSVHQWAERLDIGPVRVYRQDSGDVEGSESYVGLNADWDALELFSGYLSFSAQSFSMSWRFSGPTSSSGPGVDEATARAAAEAFLNRLAPHLISVEGAAEALQITFYLRADQEAPIPDAGFYGYEALFVVDGVSVATEGGIGNHVVVGPNGQVQWASLAPLRLVPTEEIVSPRPPEAVLEGFLGGDASLLRGSGWSSRGPSPKELPQTFYRPVSYREGEQITVDGWGRLLRGVEAQADLFLLQASTSPDVFVLEDADITPPPASYSVQVWGTLRKAEAPHVWRLQVERLESSGPKSGWEGTVQRRDDDLWLETREGQEFLLPDPPQELPDGAWVSVTGSLDADAPDHLEWDMIVVVPEVMGAEMSSQQVEVVQAVPISEPTSWPTAPPPPPLPTESRPQQGPRNGSSPTVTPPPPPPPTATPIATPKLVSTNVVELIPTSPSTPTPIPVPPSLLATATPISPVAPPEWWDYRPGDQASVEGLLSVHGYRLPDGGATVWASLFIQDPAGETTLPLAGDSLVDLFALDQLHVRVRGQILSNEEASERQEESSWGLFDQVLWVEEVEQLWPEERKVVLSGFPRIESQGGQQVALLDDGLSDQTFALPTEMITLTLQAFPDLEEPWTFIAVIEPEKEIGGYPALRVVEFGVGKERVDDFQRRLEDPLADNDYGRPDGLDEVIVEDIRLAYYAPFVFSMPDVPEEVKKEQTTAQLLYLLTGYSPDGRYQVTLRLFATEPPAQP